MTPITSFPNDVLVVDDEPVVLHVVSKVLAARGLSVSPVASAEAALDLLNQRGFGCLLTDKNLPGMDGVELIKRMRAKHPYCGAIVMTGYASMGSVVDSLRLGANDYLEKPFPDLAIVGAKVENAMKVQRTAFERDAFASRLHMYKAELDKTKAETERQKTEIELFEELLALRVRQATEDLRADLKKLQDALSKGQDANFAVKTHAESVLEAVREALKNPEPKLEGARGELARIAVRLETHIGLLKHLTSGTQKAA